MGRRFPECRAVERGTPARPAATLLARARLRHPHPPGSCPKRIYGWVRLDLPAFPETASVFTSILVKNWNGKPLLERCLDSLLPGLDGLDAEVLVVDNRSSDGSAEMLAERFPQVRLIVPSEQVSAARATNIGIRASAGDMIIHVDNDAELITRDWVRRLARPLDSSPQIGIVGCKIVDAGGSINHVGGVISPWRLHGVAHLHRTSAPGSLVDVDYVAGAVLLMTRRLIETIGPWDERYAPVYFDDTEYSARARRHGFRVVCNLDVVARHGVSRTVVATRTPTEQMRIYHRNRLRFLRAYSSDADLLVRAFMEQLVAARCIVRRQARGYLEGLVDFMREGRSGEPSL